MPKPRAVRSDGVRQAGVGRPAGHAAVVREAGRGDLPREPRDRGLSATGSGLEISLEQAAREPTTKGRAGGRGGWRISASRLRNVVRRAFLPVALHSLFVLKLTGRRAGLKYGANI